MPRLGRALQSSALRPLRHRDFALLFGANLVSNIGSWMQTVAVGTLVVDATGQAKWAALVAAATFLPIGVLSPVGGALADRVERRPFLVTGYVVATVIAAALTFLAATGHADPVPIVLLSFAGGCVAALVFPFQQAILPELVPRDDLLAAISLGSAGYNFGRVVGPALAGIVIALGSFTWAFALDAVSFLAVVAALLAMRFGPGPKVESGGLFASIREGAAVARRVPGCRSPILLIGTAALLVSPFIALVPAMADVLVEGGASRLAGATGALVTAQGVGAVLGALAIAPIAARIGRRRELVGALVATPLALLAYAASPTVPVAVVTLFLVGAGYIGILSGLATAVQVHAPDAFRGRLISLYFVALGVVYPIGSLIQGAIADRVGLRETTAGGAILMVAAMALLAITRPGVFRALDDPAGTDATPEPAGPHVADPAAPVPTVEGGA